MSLAHIYEHVFGQLRWDKKNALSSSGHATLSIGLDNLFRKVFRGFDQLKPEELKSLFVRDSKKYRTDFVADISSIFVNFIESIANKFEGHSDRYWMIVIGLFHEVFPFYDEVEGFNPVQQEIAIKLVSKMNQNMRGWYPSVSRVLLSVIQFYDVASKDNHNAFHLLRHAVYFELLSLPDLYRTKPNKFDHFLPNQISYERTTNTLTYTYSDGAETKTSLDQVEMDVKLIDLFAEENFQYGQQNRAKIISLLNNRT